VAHVAISTGDGKTIEAANSRVGVINGEVGNRFNFAAIIPGISDGHPLVLTAAPAAAVGVTAAPLNFGGPDTDHDGLSDELERRLGLDPLRADTDGDNLSDAQEMITYGTDARKADTDGDGLNDAFELAQGLDPRSPDTDHDGHMDGSLTPIAQTDSDADGLDDNLEQVLGFNPQLSDSDSDGFSDALEYHNGSNPLDPNDTPLLHQPAGAAGGAQQPLGQQQPFGAQQPFGTQQTFGTQQSFGTQQPFGAQQPYPATEDPLGTHPADQIPGGQLTDLTDLH